MGASLLTVEGGVLDEEIAKSVELWSSNMTSFEPQGTAIYSP